MSKSTLIIDSQVHAYEANTPEQPWHIVPNWPAHVTGEEMVQAMDAVGVDGAIMVSSFSMYQYDASYALKVLAKYPGRFGAVKPMDPNDPGVEEEIAEWAKIDGTVGIRIMMTYGVERTADDPGIGRIMQAAARHDMPLNLLTWGKLEHAVALADRFPETRIVLDHLGLKQPHEPPAPADAWDDLPMVLDLAKRDNMVIKVSGACTLSHQPYPYPDIWDRLAQIFDAWGMERCLWGTDWTRAAAVLNYEQGVQPFLTTDRLSDSDRAMLMGAACARVYGWEPKR
jgi:predicted TIM-barrel fold metal-dependent hydrolase